MPRQVRLILLGLILACGPARDPAPGDTVKEFYAAIYEGESQTALELCSTQMRDFAGDAALLRNFTALSRRRSKEMLELRIIEERVEDDYAVVVFGPASEPAGRDSSQLIKESGVWRIALGKPD